MRRRLEVRGASLMLVLAAGCGGPMAGLNDGGSDAGASLDAGPRDSGTTDAGSTDAGSTDAGSTESVTFTVSNPEGEFSSENGNSTWLYGAESGDLFLSVEVYSEFGGPTSASTYALKASDSNYASCGVCLVLDRGDEVYMPVVGAGSVTFTTLGQATGQHFAGSFGTLEFRQVTIDDETFETNDVPGGKRLRLSPVSWDVVLP